jgi:hypothetical protein
MARRTASKGPLTTGRRQQRRAEAQPLDDAYGVPVPAALHEAIEMERDNLSKAEALLACMIVSMEYANDPVSGPYYPAVAQIARELVERTINGLDPFELRQRLRNKIEEAFCLSGFCLLAAGLLRGPKSGIPTLLSEQGRMRAPLDHRSCLQHDNLVGVYDG